MTAPMKIKPTTTDAPTGAASHDAIRPEWIRPKDVYRHFALGRTQTYELIAAGKIKSVSMRKRGQKHGSRLISYDSLKNYLDSLATGGDS